MKLDISESLKKVVIYHTKSTNLNGLFESIWVHLSKLANEKHSVIILLFSRNALFFHSTHKKAVALCLLYFSLSKSTSPKKTLQEQMGSPCYFVDNLFIYLFDRRKGAFHYKKGKPKCIPNVHRRYTKGAHWLVQKESRANKKLTSPKLITKEYNADFLFERNLN